MPLTTIEYGSLASSEVMNDNFSYLDNRITSVAGNLTSATSSINSSIASMNSTISGQIEDINDDIDDLETSIESLQSTVSSLSFSPDYSNATTVSYASGDAVGFDGWLAVDFVANNLAAIAWIAINGIIVMQTYGGNQDGGGRFSAGICMVKATDVITYQNIVLNNVYAPVKMYKMPFVNTSD